MHLLVFHATLYDLFLNTEIQFPDDDFSMSAIARMKVTAGIDICHELAPKCRELIKKLSLPQSFSHNQSPTGTIMVVFEEWLDGKSRLPPTWAEMMAVLREIGMNNLAECIEKYFAGEQFHSLDRITRSECACSLNATLPEPAWE